MAVLLDSAPARPRFSGSDDFFKTVCSRVDAHFAGRRRRDDPRLYRKAALIGLWFLASYTLFLTTETWWLQVPLCISYALATAAMGFNIFHDAIHGSFSSNARVNTVLSRISCSVLGAGRYFWRYKHNILHHRFTNIFEWDDDIETRGSLRLSPRQPWEPKFKNQHRWFAFLYGMTTLEWIFIKDFVQYFTLKINPYRPIPALSVREKREFWICKAIYFAAFVVPPFLLMPAWQAIMGLLIFHFVLGLVLAFVFNLAHVIEKAEFPALNSASATIEDAWAAHQMRTTVNFATESGVLNWFTGGLNFQIEHHLFPNISHTHYPDIQNIVRDTAGKFGLPYHLYDTYLGVVKSHFRIMREQGTEPLPQT
jgi:linoleoyl-CoA desaturase